MEQEIGAGNSQKRKNPKEKEENKIGDVKRVPVDRNPGDVKQKTKEKVAMTSGVSVDRNPGDVKQKTKEKAAIVSGGSRCR